jgi:hypothetical protein
MSTAVDSVAEALPASLDTAVRQVRGVVTELFSAIDADPATPRQAARELGVNRNLTWKVSKIVNAPDALTLVQHLPGRSGLEILLEASGRAGAPAAAVDAVRDAVVRFDDLVRVHAGDRETLILMLNSMTMGDRDRSVDHESARKKSFQGNSVIWGMQARVRFAANFVAPNRRDPDLVDSAVVVGLMDLRRLRPNADGPLFRFGTVNDDGTPLEAADEPIDPESSSGLPLIRDYCSKPIPDIREIRTDAHTEYELVPGAVGRTGATTCVMGHYARAFASKYRDAVNEFGEHRSRLVTPVEYQVYFGRDRHLLQMSTELEELGTSPPVVATPHIAGYPRLVERVYEKLGWSAEHFTGYRLVMRYPPIPTLLVQRYDLPDRGAGGRR